MAPREEVSPLRKLSLRATRMALITACKAALCSEIDLAEMVQKSREALYGSTPKTLHADIGLSCLIGLNDWWHLSVKGEIKDHDQLSKAEKIVSTAAQLVPNKQITSIQGLGGFWKPVATTILQHLGQMPALEEFDCSNFDSVEVAVMHEELSNWARSLANLTEFDGSYYCNDKIIKIICQNCPQLKKLYADQSDDITDNCIDDLLMCKKLETVNMTDNLVTVVGYAKLIKGSDSLKDLIVGEYLSQLTTILKYTCANRTFSLEKLDAEECDKKSLRLVNRFFPSLSHLLISVSQPLDNVTLNLKYISLSAHNFNELFHLLVKFLSVKGHLITSMRLYSDGIGDQSRAQKIVDIIELCPNLEELCIESERKKDDLACLQTEDPQLFRKIQACNPFNKLKKVNSNFAKTLVHYTPNIENLYLYDYISMADDFFQNVFEFNTLEHLKNLRFGVGFKLSEKTLITIITKCEKLKIIDFAVKRNSALFITLFNVHRFIKANNYAVYLKMSCYE